MTEETKIAELLKPRYKVTAPFPFMEYYHIEVGKIYSHDWNDKMAKANGDAFSTLDLTRYPNIFRELNWYEERDEKDMPEYVSKVVHGSKVIIKITGRNFLSDDYMTWQFGNYNRNDFTPATLSDYNSYINKK